MRLYLVRHGDAVSEELDPERPLSVPGREEVERLASFLGQAGVRVARIFHSGKKRAEQTAELLAREVNPDTPPEKMSGLAPLDPIDGVARAVLEWTADSMIVGHLPFLARLLSRLITGDEEVPLAVFQAGSIVCLGRAQQGDWFIIWMTPPELVPSNTPAEP